MAAKAKVATKKTKKAWTKEEISSAYMEYVLLEGEPQSEFAFCKHNTIEESDFYKFYGSLDTLKKQVWVNFYEYVEGLLYKNKDFVNYTSREKLLSFYFTFFELLTANRSYALWALKHKDDKLESLKQLSQLRVKIIGYGKNLVENDNEDKKLKITKKPVNIVAEAVWVQFLFLLRFWLNDGSPGFEKTDVAIEKSVNTVFDVLDNTPLESILDLGKFLWKERMA